MNVLNQFQRNIKNVEIENYKKNALHKLNVYKVLEHAGIEKYELDQLHEFHKRRKESSNFEQERYPRLTTIVLYFGNNLGSESIGIPTRMIPYAIGTIKVSADDLPKVIDGFQPFESSAAFNASTLACEYMKKAIEAAHTLGEALTCRYLRTLYTKGSHGYYSVLRSPAQQVVRKKFKLPIPTEEEGAALVTLQMLGHL